MLQTEAPVIWIQRQLRAADMFKFRVGFRHAAAREVQALAIHFSQAG